MEDLKAGDRVRVWGYCSGPVANDLLTCDGGVFDVYSAGGNWVNFYRNGDLHSAHRRQCEKVDKPLEGWVFRDRVYAEIPEGDVPSLWVRMREVQE